MTFLLHFLMGPGLSYSAGVGSAGILSSSAVSEDEAIMRETILANIFKSSFCFGVKVTSVVSFHVIFFRILYHKYSSYNIFVSISFQIQNIVL